MLVNTGLRAFAPPPSGGDVTNFLLNCAANVAPLQRLTLARMHAPLVAAGALDPTVPVEGALHFLLSLLHHLHRGSSGSRPRTLRLIGATRLRGAQVIRAFMMVYQKMPRMARAPAEFPFSLFLLARLDVSR